MTRNRIVVGIDGSVPAQRALEWAAHEASRREATVLVVTAWPVATGRAPEPGPRRELIDGRMRIGRMQQAAITHALAGMAAPPVIGREIILADPVTALCHAAALADLVVVGSDEQHGLRHTSVAARVAQRLSARRRRGLAAPLVVVPTCTAEPIVPTERTADRTADEQRVEKELATTAV
jgi:nucleotide-binding universal stress UspA family protein